MSSSLGRTLRGAATGVATSVAGAAALAGAVVAERELVRSRHALIEAGPDERFQSPEDLDRHTIISPDGAHIAVFERGRRSTKPGSTLVLLHGITASHDQWAPQLRDLADRFHILAVDHRGHGTSTTGHDGFGVPQMAADLMLVLRTFDVRQCVLVGHSMGGMVILRAFVDHQNEMLERVAAVGLVSTSANMVWLPALTGPVTSVVAKAASRLPDMKFVPSWVWKDSDLAWLAVRVTFGADPPPAAIEQMKDIVGEFAAKSFWGSGAGLLQHDVRRKLDRLTLPALVVVGSRDLLTPPHMARNLAEELPAAELYVLEGAGHQLMQERPEELSALIRDLGTRIPGRGRRLPLPTTGGIRREELTPAPPAEEPELPVEEPELPAEEAEAPPAEGGRRKRWFRLGR